ncbi:MAG TPA: hypothetical protein VFV58_30885 [Blastocatellia bacterium]|jgi:hypothetical protein|nr:hypothetical protein [Blastocatellia bacterium]
MNLTDNNLREALQALTPAERAAVERLGAVPASMALTAAQKAALRKTKAKLKWRARAGVRMGKR